MRNASIQNLTVAVALAGVFVSPSFAANPNDFQVFNYYHVDGTNQSVLNMPGRLYVPTNYDPSKTYPMVMFLHGAGEAGSNNTSQINGNIDNLLAAAKTNKFFLFAPQSGGSAWQSGQTTTAMKMVSMITESYSVDISRMYVTGLSYGGGGTWTTIGQYRDVFAAAVPVVASGPYINPAHLVGKPIWSYGARDDQFITVGRNAVNAIRAADKTNPSFPAGKPALTFPLDNNPSNPYYNTGAPYYADGSTFYSENNQRYSEYKSGGHTSATWGRAYNESAMYSWLLNQSIEPHRLQVGEKLLFDLGENVSGVGGALPVDAKGFTTDSQGRVWNSNAVYKENVTVGVAVPYAKTTEGIATTVSLGVASAFNGRVTSGATAGSVYDPLIAVDGWSSSTTVVGSLVLKGLTPGAEYSISIFGSDTNNDGGRGRMSRYTIGSEYRDLNVVNNLDQFATFESVFANSLGQIVLSVAPTGTSRFANINSIEVTAVPEPAALGVLVPALLLAQRYRRLKAR